MRHCFIHKSVELMVHLNDAIVSSGSLGNGVCPENCISMRILARFPVDHGIFRSGLGFEQAAKFTLT